MILPNETPANDGADEGFAPIPGFPGYRINRACLLQSCRRSMRHGHPVRWVDISGRYNRGGYLTFALKKDGRHVIMGAHQLLMLAFVGPCPEGMQVCHWDDNPRNNELSNLRYDTPKGNVADQIRNGIKGRALGSRNRLAKLTEGATLEIRSLVAAGLSYHEIAARFKVSYQTVYNIATYRTWKHI